MIIMNNINVQETVTPEWKYSNVYTWFGHLHRDVEKLHPDGQYYPMFTEALTRHCGWVDGEDINPSFNCKQCSEGCIEYEKWEEFFSSL